MKPGLQISTMGGLTQLPVGIDIICANTVDFFFIIWAFRVGGRRKCSSTWLTGTASTYRTRREYLGGFGRLSSCSDLPACWGREEHVWGHLSAKSSAPKGRRSQCTGREWAWVRHKQCLCFLMFLEQLGPLCIFMQITACSCTSHYC